MRLGNMWLKNVFLICCVIGVVLSQDDIITEAEPGQEYVQYESSLGESARGQSRAIPIGDFVTSHKIPDGIEPPTDEEDEEDVEKVMEAELAKEVLQRAVENLDKRAEKKKAEQAEILRKDESRRQARVQLENFSDSGVLSKDGIKKLELARAKFDSETDSIIPGVEVSAENPTTMMPVLTTPREVRAFDFVPVNIIREDSKDAYTPYADRHFGDLSDVSLVPAGSNSRIQVKKGPNGKDYEYEYVYYYYDEEDEGKAGSQTNAQDDVAKPTRSPISTRPSAPGRNKYSSIDRTTTVEPATNEVIPSRTSTRGRQTTEADDAQEERLPANTRFPPRSRSNHNTGTTEPSRTRGNRPRAGLDLVDSNSFRTNQESPEFPQNLPKGPLRFLGVTPNEEAEDKPAPRGRTRPTKAPEPAPVEEPAEEPAIVPHRRRPVTAQPEIEVELNKGQPTRPSEEETDEEEEVVTVPSVSQENAGGEEEESSSVESASKEQEVLETSTTEIPTTENPSAMDKVALDLYAFSQQGQSNLVDSSTADIENDESTTLADDENSTDSPTTTETIESTTTELTTTEPTTTTTTTTTTTEAPTTTTTTTPAPTGRGRFRKPLSGGIGSRNRFKTNGPTSSTTTESSPSTVEHTARPRGRFGSATGGFKRPRPGQRQSTEEPSGDEEIRKETSSTVNAERPALPSRGRFRGVGSRTAAPTTRSPVTSSAEESSSSPASSSESTSSFIRPGLNRLNLNRRRGRPTTSTPTTSAESQESEEAVQSDSREAVSTTARPTPRTRLPGSGPRPLRPGPRINLRLRPGLTSSTTQAPETPEPSAEEPTGAGTEEESHEAPAETSPPLPTTPETPLTRLRNRNRLQVHAKAPRVATAPPAPRRSPLLPRRRTTEAPIVETSSEQNSVEEISEDESSEPTEAILQETSTAAPSQKQEELKGLSSLLAPRRRLTSRRPGQPISRE